MKIFIFSIFILISGSLNSANAQPHSDSVDLVLIMQVLPSFPVGFANCYDGAVNDVIKGKMPDSHLLMTILAGDTIYDKIFNDNPRLNQFEIGFKKYKDNEPYNTSYINGFVDKRRTSWKIIYIKMVD